MPDSQPDRAKSGRRPLARDPPPGVADFPLVGIGASAGGLDACRKFLAALPANNGMAFILVQHLDPTHESMMVELLAGFTPMTVLQAMEGMPVERDHLYIIPPGTYLSVIGGALRLSQPQARHGARLPFDFLLHSLAADRGTWALCVVLSGTGTDGSIGLQAIRAKGGFVVAQDPDEAEYGGMPRSAISTGGVSLVLPVERIPEALARRDHLYAGAPWRDGILDQDTVSEWLPAIIDLLRAKTDHDFTLYKPGTLQRRIERRMVMAAVDIRDSDRYIKILRSDPNELNLLAKDLLINVTSFFRDPPVFDMLAKKIIPDLVRSHAPDVRMPARPGQSAPPSRQTVLAELCRRMVMETYAPAAVLINRKHECLFSLGPTDRFLRVAPGHPSHDLLAMARQGVRTKLRSAIQQAAQENVRIVISGGRISEDSHAGTFSIAVQPFRNDGEDLLLICFVNDPKAKPVRDKSGASRDGPRVVELEHELDATRTELQGAIHNLEISGEEQKAINKEALSVQEEYQSTNEELLTSKEELQSLNEELTALNSQLQETLERQRTTSNDLQNVLYSTDVATLFLDKGLNIRFFTPATKALFSILPGDIGRPLSDLNSLAEDGNLLADAQLVLRTLQPTEREIETRTGSCFVRRILPYRTQNDGVEGVVITFADITERRHAADELGVLKRQADLANAAKSRFLAAASHDLRQPLQTLALVQGLLAKNVESEKARKLVSRLDETLGAMSGMLNTLLDINQIEAGTVHAEIIDFPIDGLLGQMREEFTYHAQAKGLTLRVVPCGLLVCSDPRLLEQMIRNLLSNAVKYTKRGKILLGCRRHKGTLSLQIWDTGIGIPDTELQSIFEEYYQLDNAARERSRGLGLGLSIVHRLGVLLGHRVQVRSRPGRGSVFSVEIKVARNGTASRPAEVAPGLSSKGNETDHHVGSILVVEDDPDVRELLEVFLRDEGHEVTSAHDGVAARELVTGGLVRPDLILSDYNLPNGMNGTAVAKLLRDVLHHPVPAIILTGDISTGTLSSVALQDCVQLNKPVKLRELTQAIQRLLPLSRSAVQVRAPRPIEVPGDGGPPVIFVVDDDNGLRGAMRAVLEDDDRVVEDYDTCEAFLAAFRPGREACLVIDAYLPGMNGLTLLRRLREAGHRLPAIMITGNSDVAIAVQAMKAGASDFIEKPISRGELLGCVDRALEQSRDSGKRTAWQADAVTHMAGLTPRQHQVMEMVLAGYPSKNIAADLGISRRTVENHRASIMTKTGTKSLPALARLALAAAVNDADEPAN